MADTSPLPFAPLTLAELNDRAAEATLDAGHRVRSIYRGGGDFRPSDFGFLESAATAANTYSAAADRRLALRSS